MPAHFAYVNLVQIYCLLFCEDTIAVAMSRAVEPERPLVRDSSKGFVEPVREGKEDVPLKDLIAPLDSMPPVDFAFAYGSGVFSQPLHTRARSNDVSINKCLKPLQVYGLFRFLMFLTMMRDGG